MESSKQLISRKVKLIIIFSVIIIIATYIIYGLLVVLGGMGSGGAGDKEFIDSISFYTGVFYIIFFFILGLILWKISSKNGLKAFWREVIVPILIVILVVVAIFATQLIAAYSQKGL